MGILEKAVLIIGNKYFVLCLGIAMCFAIPTTWGLVAKTTSPLNIAIFSMACITSGLAFYKFANMFITDRKKPAIQIQQW
jgi:hypothetical protein